MTMPGSPFEVVPPGLPAGDGGHQDSKQDEGDQRPCDGIEKHHNESPHCVYFVKKKRESTRFERIEGGFSVVLPVDVRQHVCVFYSNVRFITIKIPYNFVVCKDKL